MFIKRYEHFNNGVLVRVVEVKTKAIIFILALLFLMSRLVFVFNSYNSYPLPRTGDDSLYYLWKGKALFLDTTRESTIPALSNLQEDLSVIRSKNSGSVPIDNKTAWRLALTLEGKFTPLFDFYSGAILKLFPRNFKLSITIVEIGVVLIMVLAWIFFFRTFLSSYGVALGLLFITFNKFPKQGLHQFIPSTLSLSFALLAVSFFWRFIQNSRKSSLCSSFLFSFFCVATHLMGTLYILAFFIGAVLVLFREAQKKRALGQWKGWVGYPLLSFILPVLIWFVLRSFVHSLRLPEISIGLSLDFKKFALAIFENIDVFFKDIFWRGGLGFWVLGGLSFYAYGFYSKKLKLPLSSLAILLSILLGFSGTFVHVLPGYPAETTSRFWVLFVPVFLLFSVDHNNAIFKQSLTKTIFTVIFFLGLSLGFLSEVPDYLKSEKSKGANHSYKVINFNHLIKTVEKQDSLGARGIAYGDDEILLRMGLVSGWFDRKAYSLQLMPDKKYFTEKIFERKISSVILPYPRELSFFDSERGHWSNGIFLNKNQKIVIESKDHLRVFILGKVNWVSGSGCRDLLRDQENHWTLEIPAAQRCVWESQSGVRIFSIITRNLHKELNWPWFQSVSLEVQTKANYSKLKNNSRHINFSSPWEDQEMNKSLSDLTQEGIIQWTTDSGGSLVGKLKVD